METEEFLEHFGVKGMKWGVRKAASKTAAVGRGAKREVEAIDRGVRSATASVARGAKWTRQNARGLAVVGGVSLVGATWVRGLLEEKRLMRIADFMNASP